MPAYLFALRLKIWFQFGLRMVILEGVTNELREVIEFDGDFLMQDQYIKNIVLSYTQNTNKTNQLQII